MGPAIQGNPASPTTRSPFDPINNPSDCGDVPVASWSRTNRSLFCYWSPALRAAMARAIARALKIDSVRALPRLSDAQLFEGFRRSVDAGVCPLSIEMMSGLTPGEIFALTLSTMVEILAHNHPSGVAEPSRADELLTNTLKEALSLVDVRVLDHFVIGDSAAVSLAERGLV